MICEKSMKKVEKCLKNNNIKSCKLGQALLLFSEAMYYVKANDIFCRRIIILIKTFAAKNVYYDVEFCIEILLAK